jgi:hypothetical protein
MRYARPPRIDRGGFSSTGGNDNESVPVHVIDQHLTFIIVPGGAGMEYGEAPF